MNKNFAQFLLIVTLITACGPAVLPPSPTASVTQTIAPSQTPRPIPTPTFTPYPPLQTDGPCLLFANTKSILTIMDADGNGRKQFEIPKKSEFGYPLSNAISPDGRYIVYFTGSSNPPNYELTINLYDLHSEKQQSIANLIVVDFPQNLEPVTETTLVSEFDSECFNDITCKLNLVKSAFLSGIQSFAWAPNSQELAFAAQIDGQSSDFFIYSL